ncbi:MAG: hypothetical protein AAGB12_09925, partial [Pseudomonadota bacterium]
KRFLWKPWIESFHAFIMSPLLLFMFLSVTIRQTIPYVYTQAFGENYTATVKADKAFYDNKSESRGRFQMTLQPKSEFKTFSFGISEENFNQLPQGFFVNVVGTQSSLGIVIHDYHYPVDVEGVKKGENSAH